MRIFSYRNDHSQRFANLELENGDRVHVRVTTQEVKVMKLRFGQIPMGIIWAATGPKEMGHISYTSMTTNILDAIIEYLRACNSAAEIKAKLPILVNG